MESNSLIINLLITAVTFILMEGVIWFTYKFVMHWLLWGLLKSYFMVHHIIIHQLFKWFYRSDNRYIKNGCRNEFVKYIGS